MSRKKELRELTVEDFKSLLENKNVCYLGRQTHRDIMTKFIETIIPKISKCASFALEFLDLSREDMLNTDIVLRPVGKGIRVSQLQTDYLGTIRVTDLGVVPIDWVKMPKPRLIKGSVGKYTAICTNVACDFIAISNKSQKQAELNLKKHIRLKHS